LMTIHPHQYQMSDRVLGVASFLCLILMQVAGRIV
jgi:hypothetical protein